MKRISNIAALAISRMNYVFILDFNSNRFGKSSFYNELLTIFILFLQLFAFISKATARRISC